MKVSVVIPTVSRIELLREALQSVEAQTFRDLDVVIGDNSASAAYAAQVDALVAEFPGLSIRVHHHAHDLGMIGNCNFLVDAASGDYWIYLPDDDRLCPTVLARMVAALDAEPRAGLAFSDHWLIDAEGRRDAARTDENSAFYRRADLRPGFHENAALFDLAVQQVFELQSMLLRREVIRDVRFSERSGRVVDYDMQLRLWQNRGKLGAVYVPERLTEYRLHGGQFTAEGAARASLVAVIQVLTENAPPGARRSGVYRRKLASCHASLAKHLALDGERLESLQHGLQAATLDPTRPRSIASLAYGLLPRAAMRGLGSARTALREATSAARARFGV